MDGRWHLQPSDLRAGRTDDDWQLQLQHQLRAAAISNADAAANEVSHARADKISKPDGAPEPFAHDCADNTPDDAPDGAPEPVAHDDRADNTPDGAPHSAPEPLAHDRTVHVGADSHGAGVRCLRRHVCLEPSRVRRTAWRAVRDGRVRR